ncbi:YkvI family membrane protein [Coprococcus sp. AF21-14LB]|uniref:YkvI family membrane protein n=1 Tax=Coprococcus sp. AF21-14LB TaxID=2292231 RepID=UPI000E5031F8|nr:hypothetical protein [Coprococcus sp. AF21-14LB]QUO32450.1 hypothetical protein KFE17_01420 [Faecalicatena sp. Marseille-Q4148]RGS82111.1 hypothetical protein DWX73_01755 [Coprococcus sp. AF21-14LB]
MGNSEKVSWKRVLILAGAVIAFTIGSGFATGQEIIQYFTAYGTKSLLVIAVFAVAFLYYNFNFAKAGAEQKFERGNDVYKYFCGKYVGTFCDYYSTIFCYMSFWVMIGGAASTLHQEYGLPQWVGAVILTVLTILTVVGGLNSLVDAIGIVGPIIVVLCIGIGLITCISDGGNIAAGLEVIKEGAYEGAAAGETIKNAGANWLISGLSYAGFVLLWFASFTAALGAKNKKKDLNYGIIGGTIAVCVAIGLVSFAQISNINTPMANGEAYVWNADIPNLILAMEIWKPFSAIFAIVVFAGIYTTAVPLLYNPAARFAKEGTSQFKILTIVLGIIGLIVGLFLPFRVLVNVIYVLNGYVGAVLILFMIWKNIKDFRAKRAK